MKYLKVILPVFLLVLSANAKASYIAGADFVANEKPDSNFLNPNGLWSYGYRSTLESTDLTLLTNHSDIIAGNEDLEGYDLGANPVGIYANTGSSPVSRFYPGGPLAPLNPNQIALHPGSMNEFAIVRWTADITGSYDILAEWIDLDANGGNGGSGHLVINGVNILSMERFWINGGSGSALDTFFLNAGDTVDFAAGSNGSYYYDTTGFDASISLNPVPVPAAAWLFGSALLGFFGFSRRKANV